MKGNKIIEVHENGEKSEGIRLSLDTIWDPENGYRIPMTILMKKILVKQSDKSEWSVKITSNKNDKWKILHCRHPCKHLSL